MHRIFHVLHIECSVEKLYRFISTTEGLKEWWTPDTTGNPAEGGVLRFGFGKYGAVSMKVIRLINNESILWSCTEATFGDNGAWEGTEISIHLNPSDTGTEVRFEHENWEEEDAYYARCNYQWAVYLTSLKQACEKGKGQPYNL